jgi:hypothetical protein
LWFSRGTVRHLALTRTVSDRLIVNGKDVRQDASGRLRLPNIAPGDASYTVTGVMRAAEDLTLYALWPHMHSRGRAMTFSLVDGAGHEQTLLRVPRYQYQWQFTYQLQTPLRIRAGSTIKAVAQYDNSANNRDNPSPAQEVAWGPREVDEMFGPFLEIVYDRRSVSDPISDCNAPLVFTDPTGGSPGPLFEPARGCR